MRIAYYSDSAWVGGAERYLHLLAANLPRDKFEPHLVVDDASRLGALVDWMKGSGVPVHEAKLDPRPPFGARRFVRALGEIDAALFHMNMPGPWSSRYGLVAPLARLAGARAVVSTEHLPMIPPFAKGAMLKRVGGLFIDRVITVSVDNARRLRETHHVRGCKIRVVHIGVPEPRVDDGGRARRTLGIGVGEFVCLAAARLERRKGHRFALEALARLPARVKLLIAGTGEEEEPCRRLAADLGVSERVRFLGFREDIHSCIAACDALIVPSLVEATPYVIVEAMALARPVVASRIYGIPELVAEGETGLLVEPGNAVALAEALGGLEADPALAARMGNAGRTRYEERFRIERCVEATVSVYRELLGRGERH